MSMSCKDSSTTAMPKFIEPVILGVDGNDLFQYWEIDPNDSTFILTEKSGLGNFKDSLQQILGEERLAKLIDEEKSNNGVLRELKRDLPDGAIRNYLLSHTREVGEIRPIDHLESQLLNYQSSRFPLLSHPTEFLAFILSHDSIQRIRVCYAGGDQPWPPRHHLIYDHMEEAAKDGWYLTNNLHNHYEPDSADYLGRLGPSMADAQYFKMLRDEHGIPEVLITNGFHTLVMDSTHFNKFAAHQ